jgi:hypothetical protein
MWKAATGSPTTQRKILAWLSHVVDEGCPKCLSGQVIFFSLHFTSFYRSSLLRMLLYNDFSRLNVLILIINVGSKAYAKGHCFMR